MTKHDLMNGLNGIDEDLIEEASKPMKKKNPWKVAVISTVAAAASVIAVMSGIIIKQYAAIQNTATKTASANISGSEDFSQTDITFSDLFSTVGIGSGDYLGDSYPAAKNYGEVYDALASDYDDLEYASSDAYVPDAEAAEISTHSTNTAASDSDYSLTNLVTEGVDESDIIKTNGKCIYMVLSGSVRITDITCGDPGESTSLTPPLTSPADIIKEMYVDEDSMQLICSHLLLSDDLKKTEETVIYSYDLTDPLNPKLIGSMRQDGSYNTSRKMGNIMYLFTDEWLSLSMDDRDESLTEEGLLSWVPSVNGQVLDYSCFYIQDDSNRELLISSFDVTAPDTIIDAKCITTQYLEEYVSASGIFLYESEWISDRTVTQICKLSFKNGLLTTGPVTVVNGSIRDTFAINDNGSNLRVLTTDYSGSTPVNTLYVLDENLNLTGRIDEIARGEQIYAARYLNDTAYFITYENTDPLFVADLSDPANPKLLGSVEISGFSEYLHIWDENHVLGIGYDTDGDNWTDNIKLVMFDVSDPANPVVESTTILYEANYCSGLYDYKALLVEPEKNLIGFSAEDYDIGKCNYYLYRYDPENGFCLTLTKELTYEDTTGYRGLYNHDWFYIAGEGELFAQQL